MKNILRTLLLTPLLATCLHAQINRCVTIDCPRGIIVECTNRAGAVVTFAPTSQTTCGRGVNIVCTPRSGSMFPPGTTTVTCVATDDLRNTAQCEFDVLVRDTAPPAINAPEQVVTNCVTTAGARVEFTVGATDNCDPSPHVICSPPSGSLFAIGTTPVSCVATDTAGNASTNSFNVIVSGNCPANCLQITCPTNIEVTLGVRSIVFSAQILGLAGVPIHYNVEATNTCTGSNVLVECTPPSGSIFTVGTHVVNCTAVESGARAVCSFRVVVKDVTPPKVSVPRPFFAACKETRGDGVKGATVTFNVKATDNADPIPLLVCTPPSGSFFAIGTNTVTCVATDDSGNASTNSFAIRVTDSFACLLKTLEDMPNNWGFELGLTAWAPEGDAFEDQPVEGDRVPVKRVAGLKNQMENAIGGDYWHELTYPVGHKGDHWIGTAENINALPGGLFDDSPTEARTGTLRSKSFIIQKPHISFLIGGKADEARLRVELLIQTDAAAADTVEFDGLNYKMWAYETGHNREVMRWESWGVFNQQGKRAIIRIIDQSSTGHLNVDDFRFEETPILFQTVTIGGNQHNAWIKHEDHLYRWDSPVWGFADMHTHPMSHLGFGGFVMHGKPDGNMASSLENCRCSHGGWGFDNECGDYLREIVMGVMEDGVPNPHGNGYTPDNAYAQFNGWPVFWTISHQQMWHEWMKRAHDGGLRVMVALCVNNPLLAVGTKGNKANDDKTVGDAQIEGLKNFVDRHSDFMEIAYDPFEMRDIVRRNKLAVIIGSELDDIGNFARNNSVNQLSPSQEDKDKVRAEIDRLYNDGLRYIFPVHLVNNHFGGTAIAGDMLNVANKFLNHEAFKVEAGTTGERITMELSDLDFTEEALGIAAAAPLLPLILPALLPVADAFLATQGVPPGTGTAIGLGVLPLALLGIPLLPVVGIEIGEAGIPSEVLPLFGNFPNYYQKDEQPGWDHGHKNAKGLTPLGTFAVREMMKRGMMIDIDHMSQKAVETVLGMAEENPVGYPLNSGHNSPRDLGLERSENSRTTDQIERVRQLGGLWGIGYENSESKTFDDKVPDKQYTSSNIPNDCAGTSKTFAQYYLYGIEAMRGRGVALGTDINGLIPGPGPRFGPQSAFALGADPGSDRRDQVLEQHNGVRYTPEHGRPLTTPAFIGRAIDPGVQHGYPRTELGYAYNIEQGDVFAAIRIFYWLKDDVEDGMSDADALAYIKAVADNMSGNYPNRGRVLQYAYGMIKGIKNWDVGSDLLDGDVERLQRIGKALCIDRVLGQGVPDDVKYSSVMKPRYERAVQVWHHYHRIFGENVPLKRCRTDYKQWDINFEGVAHYGLLPDFLQDLSNVGMDHNDMSVLFKSAEHFAQMWTKTLTASSLVGARFYPIQLVRTGNGDRQIEIKINLSDEDLEVEETENLSDDRSWRPFRGEIREENGHRRATVPMDPNAPHRFFRLRKK